MDLTTAFWGMVINNPDETDLALVRQGYPDYLRQLVYTHEVGEGGTPHIQAYLKLYRQQRLSYVKKLFPCGNFKALLADEYKLNAQRYAQKLDATAASPAFINNNPFPDPVVELTSVCEAAMKNFMPDMDWANYKENDFLYALKQEEFHRVSEKPVLAKFYVSATYKSVKKDFWRAILINIVGHTHTHTHTREKLSHQDTITDDGEDSEDDTGQDSTQSGTEEDGEDYEDGGGSSDEGHSEGSGSIFSSEDA